MCFYTLTLFIESFLFQYHPRREKFILVIVEVTLQAILKQIKRGGISENSDRNFCEVVIHKILELVVQIVVCRFPLEDSIRRVEVHEFFHH